MYQKEQNYSVIISSPPESLKALVFGDIRFIPIRKGSLRAMAIYETGVGKKN